MAQAARRKKTRKPNRRSKRSGAPWSVLITGLVCGAVLTALFLGYRENEPGSFGSGIRSLMEKESQPERQAVQSSPRETPKPAPKVTLDYHEVLPNFDEVLSEDDLLIDEEPVAGRSVEKEPDYEYVLQAGSYKSERDAESMKAKLLLSGFEPVIQRVTIRFKGTYYRVRLGPYQSKRKLHLDKKRLADQGINAMALRLEEPG